MTVGPGFRTEKNAAKSMPFLRCVELYCFAEGSGHIFRPLRQCLGSRRFPDSEVEMALREWISRFVLRRDFELIQCLTVFTEYFQKQWYISGIHTLC